MFTAELEISTVSCLMPSAVWAYLEVLFCLGTHTSNLTVISHFLRYSQKKTL